MNLKLIILAASCIIGTLNATPIPPSGSGPVVPTTSVERAETPENFDVTDVPETNAHLNTQVFERFFAQQRAMDLHSRAGTESYQGDEDGISRNQAATMFFRDRLANDENLANGLDVAKYLKEVGLLDDDPRFTSLYAALKDENGQFKTRITMNEFITMLVESRQGMILEKAFRKDMAIPEFSTFCQDVKEIFEGVRRDVPVDEGANAAYIPQLEKVDPNLFGIAICTVDGQRFKYGDAVVPFSVQSCCKPLNYCIALEENGEDKVHEHVGCEPSGVAFNSICLNGKGLPHNPFINSGAIMTCSLIQREKREFERFDHISKKYEELSGGKSWSFCNSIYLSELETADRNRCLAYMMSDANAFPANTDVQKTLEFYFRCCSMETDCDRLATATATLANGGECPVNGNRIFSRETCRNVLSIMSSCGMYDNSGEWAFRVGIPAKSGVSGVIYGVIPDVCSITIYSPPLNPVGNSVRGVEFFKRLVSKYVFHNYDTVSGVTEKQRINPRRNTNAGLFDKISALYAAAGNSLGELRSLLISGAVPASVADYDNRTLLHLAACEGHLAIVKYLVKKHRHQIDINARDRWDGTAYSEAVKNNHMVIAQFLRQEYGDELKIDTPKDKLPDLQRLSL